MSNLPGESVLDLNQIVVNLGEQIAQCQRENLALSDRVAVVEAEIQTNPASTNALHETVDKILVSLQRYNIHVK